MSCQCHELPDAFYLDDGPPECVKQMKQLDMANWMRLFECPQCGSLWAVDEWDKYTHQVVSRVSVREGWNLADTKAKRKALLLASRGGLTDEQCIWAGCSGRRVKGVVYCLEHLWKSGARK
jgi:hypothetical protein